VQLRIGIVQGRELEIQMDPDTKPEDIHAAFDTAASESSTLWLTDSDGNEIGISAAQIAYLNVIANKGRGPIGFATE
jgi:Protein of unknown function (DUF3107)